MGDMALEIALADQRRKERVEQQMSDAAGFEQMHKPRRDGARYQELLNRIHQTQDQINEVISNLNGQLEYVRDMNDAEKVMPGQPTAADEPNRTTLESNLDEIHQETMRIFRRLTALR